LITVGLANKVLDLASVHWLNSLRLERPSVLAGIEIAIRVHSLLERITLPAEYVVSMGTKAPAITVGEDEGVLAVSGPHVVETCGIPQGLETDPGYTNGMGGWARACVLERLGRRSGVDNGVEHVRLMIGAVKVLAIPASD
jgi:hypothetical protein